MEVGNPGRLGNTLRWGNLLCGLLCGLMWSPHLSCKRDQIKMKNYMHRRVTPPKRVTYLHVNRGPFLERKGNFLGPRANFKIKTCWIVAQFLTYKPVNFSSLSDNFIVWFSKLLKLWSWMQIRQTQNSFLGPKSHQDFLETGPGPFAPSVYTNPNIFESATYSLRIQYFNDHTYPYWNQICPSTRIRIQYSTQDFSSGNIGNRACVVERAKFQSCSTYPSLDG